jgi:hypothetical protein
LSASRQELLFSTLSKLFRIPQDAAPRIDKPTEGDTQMASPTVEPAPVASRKRPRIDLSSSDTREKKRGKTMFGLLVGTLNKAKNEDRERNATEAVRL